MGMEAQRFVSEEVIPRLRGLLHAHAAWIAAEDRRLQRLAPYQLSMRIGGVYQVAEKFTAA